MVEGNDMAISASEGLIVTSASSTVSGIISRGNYYENLYFKAVRNFWGPGKGHVSDGDTFKINGGGFRKFADNWTLKNSQFVNTPVRTFAVGDETPSVIGGGIFRTANTSTTTITNFRNGAEGERVTILVDANTTVQNSANVKLAGGSNFVGTSNDILELVDIGGIWYEESR